MRKRVTLAAILTFGCVLLGLATANFFPDQTWRALTTARTLCGGIVWWITPMPSGADRNIQDSPKPDLEQKSERIQGLLRAGKFNEAEPLARECIRQLPEEIYFLGQLEMILNGQGKFREADELRDKIRNLWEKDYEAKWIARGSPVGESSWARVVGSSKEYDVFGVEYFVPRVLEGSDRDALFAYYKVIAFPKTANGRSRIFQLDKSANEKHYFLEEFSDTAISMAKMYGNELPDIRAVVADAIDNLDGKKDKQAGFRPPAYGTDGPKR